MRHLPFSRPLAAIGGKEAGEAALRGEADMETDVGDLGLHAHELLDRPLHERRVEVEVGREPCLRAEQLVEMGRDKPPPLVTASNSMSAKAIPPLTASISRTAHAKIDESIPLAA